jgi:hypothetical protein
MFTEAMFIEKALMALFVGIGYRAAP